MSEYFDHFHRWEPLAEFHFILDSDDDEDDEENYLYCLCSRAFIRDGVRTYYVDKEEGSESDMEVQRDSHSQEWDDQSHVHFSLDTSYKVKCERDEGASCYCSASHTDNCCSTDEHEVGHIHGTSHALQPSDSGADLTYQDCHSDYTNHDKLERMDQDFLLPDKDENYLSETTWDKFWAVNGERLIWASWIKKYSDYINPEYLDENNDLVMDENNIPKQRSVDQIYKETDQKNQDDEMRERKFSYDSKVNPYKKSQNHNQNEKQDKNEMKDESWLPITRRRSCSEHERIVSPRTLAATDSMTNVTKITMSSYDVSSSHVTSESTPTDDYSVSSNTSDDPSNDQTRIANLDNLEQPGLEEMDTEQYWQYLWKRHFGEQYALHFANYIETHNVPTQDLPAINVESVKQDDVCIKPNFKPEDKPIDIDYENSEGNSQEMPTVIEVQAQVKDISLEEQSITAKKADKHIEVTLQEMQTIQDTIEEENAQDYSNKDTKNAQNMITVTAQNQMEETPKENEKPHKRAKRKTNRYLDSVGLLLQNLLKEEQSKMDNMTEIEGDGNRSEIVEAGDDKDKTNRQEIPESSVESTTNLQQSISNNNFTSYSYDDGDDDPPEDTPISLKRSHEIDDEETVSEKIKSTFEIMGFCMRDNKMPKGAMVYRKRLARLRPPRYRRFGAPKKTYFDEEGNPVQDHQREENKKEMQTDEDNQEFNTTETDTHTDITETDTHTDITEQPSSLTTTITTDSALYAVENKTENVGEDDKGLEAAAIPFPSDIDQSSDNLDEKSAVDNNGKGIYPSEVLE